MSIISLPLGLRVKQKWVSGFGDNFRCALWRPRTLQPLHELSICRGCLERLESRPDRMGMVDKPYPWAEWDERTLGRAANQVVLSTTTTSPRPSYIYLRKLDSMSSLQFGHLRLREPTGDGDTRSRSTWYGHRPDSPLCGRGLFRGLALHRRTGVLRCIVYGC